MYIKVISSNNVCRVAFTRIICFIMRVLLLLAVICSASNGQDYFREPEKVISEKHDLGDNKGHYSFVYETAGGILQKEIGSRKYAGTPDETQLIQGSVQYNAPDGTPIALSWTADEFGTQVAGAHLPTPPPTPIAILRALEWIANHPSTPETPTENEEKPTKPPPKLRPETSFFNQQNRKQQQPKKY